MTPAKSLRASSIAPIFLSLFLILFSQHSFSSELLNFNCSLNLLNQDPISCENPITNQSVPGNLLQLVKDLAKSTHLERTVGDCFVDTIGNAHCDYALGGDITNKIVLDCEKIPGTSATVCTSHALADAIQIGCNFALTSLNGFGCHFEFNKEKIINKATSLITDMNQNHTAIAHTMIACVSQSSMDEQVNWMCENIIKRMMSDDPQQAAQNAAEVSSMIKIMTPAKTDATMDVSHAALSSGVNNIRQRLGNLRSGIASNTSLELHYFDGKSWHTAGTQLAQTSNTASDASPQQEADRNISKYGRWGIYLNGSFTNSEQDSSDIEAGHEADTQTITLGFDYRVSNQLILGAAANISQSEAEYSMNSGTLDNLNVTHILYSSYYSDDWFFDSSLSYGQDSYEQERSISCSDCYFGQALDQTYSSEFDGSQLALSVSTGYNWNLRAFSITPSIQYTFATLKTDAYNENASHEGNGADMALAMSDQERDVSTLKAGASFQYVFGLSRGVIIPQLSAHIVEELEDDSQVVTSNYIGNGKTNNTSFELATNEVDTSYYIIGTSLSFQLKNGNAGFINIQSTEGYDDLEQIQYTAGWRWEI